MRTSAAACGWAPRRRRWSPSSSAAASAGSRIAPWRSPPAAFGTLTADALEAHKLYVVEVRHPVEVPGAERAHMTKWLSKRLGHRLQVPDLTAMNLKLVGGRLLPGPGGASAFYMYESPSGERYTVYCAKADTAPQTALRFKSEKQFAAFYWVDEQPRLCGERA